MEAERLGNWELHLQSIHKMLPLFHAAGHLPYAKSAQLYLQDMAALECTMDHEEFCRFTRDGFFTIRRSDKPWSGIWPDMTIEQTLNRFFGTDLKHGRGVTPGVIARYLLAMPSAFTIMAGVEEFSGMITATSEQHTDLGHSRQKRDEEDVTKLLFWINEHQPFKPRTSLISLSTGIVGGPHINCHLAKEKGRRGMMTMIGKNAKNISLSMANRVKHLDSAKAGIHLGDVSSCAVDSTLLFQRICVLFQGNPEQTEAAFQYELSPFPLSLFNDEGFMRKTQKSDLYKIFKPSIEIVGKDFTFVVDGGFLLHSVSWPHGLTYQQISDRYLDHIVKNYGSNSWVVFDGYSDENVGTKSYERYRRQEKIFAADVDFSKDMLITLTQAKFLSNVANKAKFVLHLSEHLRKSGIKSKIAEEDADTLIVNTAIDLNDLVQGPVAVVGNDVDLFVLLIGLIGNRGTMYFYKVVPNGKTKKLYCTRDHKHLQQFILFAHAFAGCDTTSAIYNKGKRTILTLLEKNQQLQQLAQVFYEPQSSKNVIYSAAQKFILHLYGVADDQPSLGAVRYKKFQSSAALGKAAVRLAQLPPTTAALHEHAKRVYLQVQWWLGNKLNAEDWGWKKTTSILLPIMTMKDAAPPELLTLISCGCLADCQSSRCGCRKAGMACSVLCKNCNGFNCTNASATKEYDIGENDIEDTQDEWLMEDED